MRGRRGGLRAEEHWEEFLMPPRVREIVRARIGDLETEMYRAAAARRQPPDVAGALESAYLQGWMDYHDAQERGLTFMELPIEGGIAP